MSLEFGIQSESVTSPCVDRKGGFSKKARVFFHFHCSGLKISCTGLFVGHEEDIFLAHSIM